MAKNQSSTGTPAMMRNIFGIIMIVIYLGMALLFFTGYFNPLFNGSWSWVNIAGGTMFAVYGIWRAYRQFKGIDAGYGNDDDTQQ